MGLLDLGEMVAAFLREGGPIGFAVVVALAVIHFAVKLLNIFREAARQGAEDQKVTMLDLHAAQRAAFKDLKRAHDQLLEENRQFREEMHQLSVKLAHIDAKLQLALALMPDDIRGRVDNILQAQETPLPIVTPIPHPTPREEAEERGE